MAGKQGNKSAAKTHDELLFDIQEVMTVLSELKHEPHGGGRQARHHSQQLATLIHELQRELHHLPEGERMEWEQDMKKILNMHVDGAKGKTLGDYLESDAMDAWGKDYTSYWENSDHHEAMKRELHQCMEQLRKSCKQHKKC